MLVPLIVVTKGGGVQVVVVVDGGKRMVHGNEQDTVKDPSQNVVIMYIVPLVLSSAPGVYVLLRPKPAGITNGNGKEVPRGTMTSYGIA